VFHRTRLAVPASSAGPGEERVFVNRTKDQIKDAPEFDEDRFDESHRTDLGTYHGHGGRGWRDRTVHSGVAAARGRG
jgi:hypothetical protein